MESTLCTNTSLEDRQRMGEEAEKHYDYVRFTFTDINGISRCKLVKRKWLRKYFETGAAIYEAVNAVCFRGEIFPEKLIDDRPFYQGNVDILPQKGTLHPVPSGGTDKVRLGEVLCELRYVYDGTYQQSCPRLMARKQLNDLKQLGFELKSGFEMEWILVDAKTSEPAFSSSGHVFNGPAMTPFIDVMFEIDQCLEQMNVDLDTLQTEYSPGQLEFVATPQIGMKSPDDLVIARDGIREVTTKYGKKAVFMAKAFRDQIAANGLHWSVSLVDKKGDNAFYDKSDDHNMSAIFYHWIAGIIKHSSAITALCCPTVNCYRRLHHPHSWTPTHITWGIDDRVAAYRIKNHSRENTFMECRLPSSGANPYLVIAAIVAAGVDGIKNELECPPRVKYTNGKPDGSYLLFPQTLAEALQALNEDACIREKFGPEFIKWFNINKKFEIDELVNSEVRKDDDDELNFEKERDMYFKYL